MSALNIHERWNHLSDSIKHLVVSSEKYIVFIDNDIDLDWETSDELDIELESHKEEVNRLKNQISQLEGEAVAQHNEIIQLHYKRMLGDAFVRMLESDFKQSGEMIQLAKEYLEKRNFELSRLWILQTAFASLGVCCVLLFVVILLSYVFQMIAIFTSEIMLSFIVGGFGSIISIILRLGKTHFDHNSGKKAHICDCISKVVVGSFAGVLLFILVRIKFILPFINDYANTGTLYIVFLSFIAGSSERFIPSILSTYKIEIKE